jgi:hypothetical protein
MDVFSMELGIRLSFVKTSEFRGGDLNFQPPLLIGTPLFSVICKSKLLRGFEKDVRNVEMWWITERNSLIVASSEVIL